MPLVELVNYGRGKGLFTEAGFRPKEVRFLLRFSKKGDFIGVQPYGSGKKGITIDKCPHLQFSGDTPMRQFLVDTAEYYALYNSTKDETKLRRKHEFLLELLTTGGKVIPQLSPIISSLTQNETLEQIRKELQEVKAKSTDNVTIAIESDNGTFWLPVEDTVWHNWWREYVSSLKKVPSDALLARCLITGELCEPALTHPKIRGLKDVGGEIETTLVSFNESAFCSYGLKQSLNAPISAEATHAYAGALNELISTTSRKLGNVRVLYWYMTASNEPAEPPQDEDPFEILQGLDGFFEELSESENVANSPNADLEEAKPSNEVETQENEKAEAVARAKAKEFLESVEKGKRADLFNHRYHVLIVSGNSGRAVIRDYLTGQFGDLCCSINQWFNDLEIVHRNSISGESAPPPKFYAVLASMYRELKDIQKTTATALWRCATEGERIPDAFLAQALRRTNLDVIQGNAPRHARIGLLKAYLCRKGDTYMKPTLNEDHPDPAYHCGRLLAVLDEIQRLALPEVKAGIVQRYYGAASATPALVLGRLIRLANIGHLPKLKEEKREEHEEQLADIWTRLESSPPATLSLYQQTLFAMGFYQQKAQPRNKEK